MGLDSLDRLLSIAGDWSYWDAPPGPSVPRRIDLPSALQSDIALVVQGVRRCGKSTLLSQFIERYELERAHCLFMNFEDPRLAGSLDHELLSNLVQAFERRIGPTQAVYFLDEIQHVSGWERWIRLHVDRPVGRRFVLTGSNAHLLSGELASSLTGRHLTVELFPFDLKEWRTALSSMPSPGEPRSRTSFDSQCLQSSVQSHLKTGGFPAPVLSADGPRLLRTYFNDIIERDVRERVAARTTAPLRHLGQMLFESAGSELSQRRLAAAIGMSPDTVSLYLRALEDAYLVFSCPYFAWSARQRLVRNKKYYPIDTGLRHAVVTGGGDDRGRSLECAVYLELRKAFGDVYYWRDGGEVDFVVLQGGKPMPVQVSWDGPLERHHRALDAFYAAHPHACEAAFVSAEDFDRGLVPSVST